MEVEETISEIVLIENRQLKWLGNLGIMNDNRIPKMVYEWEQEGRRLRVR